MVRASSCPFPASPRAGIELLLCALAPTLAAWLPTPSHAASYVGTVQPANRVTTDTYLQQNNPTQKSGGSSKLTIQTDRASHQQQSNAAVRIPLGGLAGKTVLQAWLRLSQPSANAQRLLQILDDQLDGSMTRAVGGLGMGLAFARGLADAMGRRLGAAPAEPKGTEFSLRVPLA